MSVDLAGRCRSRQDRRGSGLRSLEPKSAVRSVRVVVADILAQHAFETASVYAARRASTSSSKPSITMVGGVRSVPSGRATHAGSALPTQ
jgi:hypothetical protein